MRKKRLEKKVKVRNDTHQELEKIMLDLRLGSHDQAIVYLTHLYKRRWRSKDELETLDFKIHGFIEWGRV